MTQTKILLSEMNLKPGDLILLNEYGFSEWSFFVYLSKSNETPNCHILLGAIIPCNEIWECPDDWFDYTPGIKDHVEVIHL